MPNEYMSMAPKQKSSLDYTGGGSLDGFGSSSSTSAVPVKDMVEDPLFSGHNVKTNPTPSSAGLVLPGQPGSLSNPATPVGAIPFGPPAPASPVYNDSRGASQRLQVRQKATEMAKTISTPPPVPAVAPSQFQADALTPQADKQGQQNALLASTVATPGVIQSNKLGETAIRGAGEVENAKAKADMAASEAKSKASTDAIKAQNDAATAAGVSMKYVTQKDPVNGTEVSFWVNSTTGQPQLPPSNEPIVEGKFGQQQGDMILNGQYFGLTTGQAEAIEKAGGDVKKKWDETIGAQERQSAQDQATALIRGGQSGGFLNSQISGTAATKAGPNWVGAGGTLKRLQDDYDRAITKLKEDAVQAEQTARSYALTAARTGKAADFDAANAAKNYIGEVQAKQKTIDEDFQKKQKATLELQKLDVSEGGAIYSMVQAGTQPTQEDLDIIDEMRGYMPGTAQSLYSATKKIQDRKTAKEATDAYKDGLSIQRDLAALEEIPMNRQMKQLEMQEKLQKAKTASYSEMNDIFGAMQKVPPGLPIPIGDASYFGISGGAVFEKDKNGDGRLGYKDLNGNFKVQSIGFMGNPEDLEEVYVDGQPMLRNKKTKQITPVSTTSGVCSTDTGWDQKFPVGSKGGQCGTFGHSFVSDYPYGLNTLDQKLSVKNVEPTDELKRGDLGFQDIGGESGHVFVVQGTFKDESGREYISYIDSNRGLDERVRVGTMPKDTATIKGYFRGKVRPDMLTGTDSAGAKNEPSENENPFITPGVAMTPSQQQAAEQDFRKSKAWVAELLDGADAKDIPADIKPIVKQMAKQQGWKDPNSKPEPEVAESYDQFADEYQNALGMSLAPEKLKAEYDKYLGQFDENRTLSGNEQTAKDIFDGVSNLNINTLPAADKAEVSAALAKYKRKALENGDLVASFRASAGGKDVSDAFLQSYEKSSSVLDRIADLQKSIGETSTGPIQGIIKSRNPYDTKAREIQTQLNALVPGLARGVYGEVGVLTDKDVELYSRTLPNLNDTPAVNKAILSATLRSVSNSIEKKLETQAAGGRDVSGYVDSYLGLKNQANQLLAEAAPNSFRVVKGILYKKQGNEWVIQK